MSLQDQEAPPIVEQSLANEAQEDRQRSERVMPDRPISTPIEKQKHEVVVSNDIEEKILEVVHKNELLKVAKEEEDDYFEPIYYDQAESERNKKREKV